MSNPLQIPRGQSWEFEWSVERKETSSGVLAPIDSSSTVRAWLSATFKGNAIAPESIVALSRRGLGLRVDARPLWAGVLDAESVTTALAGIATGDQVAEVLEVDGERYSSWLTVVD